MSLQHGDDAGSPDEGFSGDTASASGAPYTGGVSGDASSADDPYVARVSGGGRPPGDSSWASIINQLDLQGAARQLASHCVLAGRQPGIVRLAIDPRVKFVRTTSQEEKLAQALSRHYGETVRLEFTMASGEAETPALAEQRASQQELEVARQAFETDPGVKGLRERFGATLLPDTIRPIK